MINKSSSVSFLLCVASFSLTAGEPDESGVGGTGRSNSPETLLELFHKPDLPERINLPDVVSVPAIPAVDGGAAAAAVPPSFDTGSVTGGASAVGTSAPSP